ncbi:sigma-70 region 4 domain-containing protein, partial [Streptomyces sp. SID11385]|uniref:sigma-70 region 4 domain-containing protein n=1 Tax=Streptomyces sp. SID11385 TaxID=2706031 RepID=UPI0013CBF36D
VHAALRRLRRKEREVLTLCVWSGLGYAEAAEALGVPVGTVRSRLSRARARLLKLSEAGEPGTVRAEADGPVRDNRTEPGRGSGEVQGGAAFAALPAREENR